MADPVAQAGVGGSCFTRVLRLSLLAPEIVQATLRDRQSRPRQGLRRHRSVAMAAHSHVKLTRIPVDSVNIVWLKHHMGHSSVRTAEIYTAGVTPSRHEFRRMHNGSPLESR